MCIGYRGQYNHQYLLRVDMQLVTSYTILPFLKPLTKEPGYIHSHMGGVHDHLMSNVSTKDLGLQNIKEIPLLQNQHGKMRVKYDVLSTTSAGTPVTEFLCLQRPAHLEYCGIKMTCRHIERCLVQQGLSTYTAVKRTYLENRIVGTRTYS